MQEIMFSFHKGGSLPPPARKHQYSYRNTKVSGALAAPAEVTVSMRIADFGEIRGISWNFMEIHRIPWKCVKSVISVKFQISSGTHLRNTKESLRLSRVLAAGPGRLDLHKNHEEVQNSKKKYAAPTENTKDILSFLFS